MVVIGMLFIRPQPNGYGYTPADMGACNGSICLALIFGSLVLGPILSRRTHPQHRLVLLGAAVVFVYGIVIQVVESWNAGGFWRHGDKLFMLLITACFIPQCLIYPTVLSIGGLAASKGTNVDGSVMGIQMTFSNLGQALGPILAAVLFEIHMLLPFVRITSKSFLLPQKFNRSTGAWEGVVQLRYHHLYHQLTLACTVQVYLLAFEFLAMVVNFYVYVGKRTNAEPGQRNQIERSFCDLSPLPDDEE